jgi:replicative DNA helicase
VPTAANSAYYARIVAERAVLRRLVEAGTRIVQMGYGAAAGTGRDVDDIVDLAQQAVYDVTERRSGDDFAILADLLQPALDEIEAVGSRDGVMVGVPTGFGDLDRLLNGLHPGQLIVVAGRPGLGKALALDTPLPTPDGWTTMGRVRIGDRLLDAAGRSTVVTALSEVQFDRPCYEVVFSDGSTIVADGSHRWLTRPGPRGAGDARRGAHHRRDPGHAADRGPPDEPLGDQHRAARAARPRPAVGPYTVGAWLGADEGACAEPEVTVHIEAEGEGCDAATIGRLRTLGVSDGPARSRPGTCGRRPTSGARCWPACWTPPARWRPPATSSCGWPTSGWRGACTSSWSASATGAR